MRRRLLIAFLVVVGVPLVVLAVEVQMARTGDRLDDEDGFRPDRLVVRSGPDPLRVVWLGDSTATGVGADDVTETMAHRVTARVTDGPVTLTVLARSGAQVHEVIDDQLPLLQAADADLVFVSIGANDVTALTREPTFRTRYQRMVATIEELARDAEVVLVGIPDIGTAPRLAVPLRQLAGLRGAQLDDEIAQVARERGHPHVDLAERTGDIFASDPDRYFAADDYHPSAAGHEVWADAVVASLGS